MSIVNGPASGPVWGIVLAGGSGQRFGGLKQFCEAGNERLVDIVVRTMATVCDALVVVVPEGHRWDGAPVAAAVAGGSTRAQSVRCGLAAVASDAEIIVVHDAAHPLASTRLFEAVIGRIRSGAIGAAPGLPIAEILRHVSDGYLAGSISKAGVMSIQTPHAFRADVLRRAHVGDPEVVEDTELIERLGHRIAVVPGDPLNLHVTDRHELDLVALLRRP